MPLHWVVVALNFPDTEPLAPPPPVGVSSSHVWEYTTIISTCFLVAIFLSWLVTAYWHGFSVTFLHKFPSPLPLLFSPLLTRPPLVDILFSQPLRLPDRENPQPLAGPVLCGVLCHDDWAGQLLGRHRRGTVQHSFLCTLIDRHGVAVCGMGASCLHLHDDSPGWQGDLEISSHSGGSICSPAV